MFSLTNLIISIIILIRLYRYDKFYLLTYDMKLTEANKNDRREKKNNR